MCWWPSWKAIDLVIWKPRDYNESFVIRNLTSMIFIKGGEYIPVISFSIYVCKLHDSTFFSPRNACFLSLDGNLGRNSVVQSWIVFFRDQSKHYFCRHISGSHFRRPTYILRSVRNRRWMMPLQQRIAKGCFTRFSRCDTKGPTRPLRWKDSITLPAKKAELFQQRLPEGKKVFHTFLNEILQKKYWIPSSNLDRLLTKSRTSCCEKKYPMTQNVFTSG